MKEGTKEGRKKDEGKGGRRGGRELFFLAEVLQRASVQLSTVLVYCRTKFKVGQI